MHRVVRPHLRGGEPDLPPVRRPGDAVEARPLPGRGDAAAVAVEDRDEPAVVVEDRVLRRGPGSARPGRAARGSRRTGRLREDAAHRELDAEALVPPDARPRSPRRPRSSPRPPRLQDVLGRPPGERAPGPGRRGAGRPPRRRARRRRPGRRRFRARASRPLRGPWRGGRAAPPSHEAEYTTCPPGPKRAEPTDPRRNVMRWKDGALRRSERPRGPSTPDGEGGEASEREAENGRPPPAKPAGHHARRGSGATGGASAGARGGCPLCTGRGQSRTVAGRRDPLDRPPHPAVAASRQGLDVARGVRVVAESGADLAHAEVERLLEVHEGARGPDLGLDLLAGHHVAGAPGEEHEHLEGLRLEAHRRCRSSAARRCGRRARRVRSASPGAARPRPRPTG